MDFVEPEKGVSPFILWLDQNAYTITVLVYGAFTFLLGRYPTTHFITFCQVLMPTLLFLRFLEFRALRWHLMLLDFCYFQVTLTLYFITFDPKNKIVFRACYMNSFGILSLATILFANRVVFHKMYYLTSVMIHVMPNVLMCVVTNIIMVEDASLPESERRFCTISESEKEFSLN